MSVPQQFTGYGEQLLPSPVTLAVAEAASLCEQPIEQGGASLGAGVLWQNHWPVSTQCVSAEGPFGRSQEPQVRYLSETGDSSFAERFWILVSRKTHEQGTESPYGILEAPRHGPSAGSILGTLERSFVVEGRSAIPVFIERNHLLEPILASRGPLTSAFGEAAVKKLTLFEDDEGFVSLFCLILFPGELEKARQALNSFDENWWLARSHETGGKLNFDFELI